MRDNEYEELHQLLEMLSKVQLFTLKEDCRIWPIGKNNAFTVASFFKVLTNKENTLGQFPHGLA